MCGAERSLVCVGLSKSVFALIALRSNIVYCVRIWGRMRIKEAECKRGGKCAMYVMGLEGRGRPTVARTSRLFVLRRAMDDVDVSHIVSNLACPLLNRCTSCLL